MLELQTMGQDRIGSGDLAFSHHAVAEFFGGAGNGVTSMKPLYFNPASKRHFSFGLALIILTLAGCQKEQQVKDSPAPAPRADSVPVQNNSAAPQYSYADVIERASPAVVTIRSERRVRAPRQFPFFGNPLFGDPPGGPPRRSSGAARLGIRSHRAFGWYDFNEPSRC